MWVETCRAQDKVDSTGGVALKMKQRRGRERSEIKWKQDLLNMGYEQSMRQDRLMMQAIGTDINQFNMLLTYCRRTSFMMTTDDQTSYSSYAQEYSESFQSPINPFHFSVPLRDISTLPQITTVSSHNRIPPSTS